MKREIKFRVWFQEKFNYFIIGQSMTDFQSAIYTQCCILGKKFYQFTGLKDKNGVDIYEGDICEGHSDGIGVITWTDFDGGYNYVFEDGNSVGILEVKEGIEVIGDIHESPELLGS